LLIQYIRSHPPYLAAVSSIRNQIMLHAVVTETNMTCEHGNKGKKFLDQLSDYQFLKQQ
jgi:hypothetical protein